MHTLNNANIIIVQWIFVMWLWWLWQCTWNFPTIKRTSCNRRCNANPRNSKIGKRKMKIKKGYAFRVRFLWLEEWNEEEEKNEIISKSIAINQRFSFNLCKYVRGIPTWGKFIKYTKNGIVILYMTGVERAYCGYHDHEHFEFCCC